MKELQKNNVCNSLEDIIYILEYHEFIRKHTFPPPKWRVYIYIHTHIHKSLDRTKDVKIVTITLNTDN